MSVSTPQFFTDKVPKVTLTFDYVTKNQKDSSSHDGGLIYEAWKWSDQNIGLYRVFNKKCYGVTHSLTLARTHPTTHERLH